MELNDIRARIDAIDDELVRLFARRMDCSAEVARVKQGSGGRLWKPSFRRIRTLRNYRTNERHVWRCLFRRSSDADFLTYLQ